MGETQPQAPGQALDLTKLITTGKRSRTVTIGDFEILLETPNLDQTKGAGDNFDIAVAMISKVTDVNTKSFVEYNTPEKKKELATWLNRAQGGLVSWIIARCDEIGEAQQQDIENIAKK